ncbi:unnamed protein product [Soboliphyme baturini]|uniref:Tyrosine-protein kinase n=1 Tax=Soboliphyme baturini TaxID=241478 RepID=A0A183IH20_9BILA|nr:unnamed protein product [Soboliphyme baturini]
MLHNRKSMQPTSFPIPNVSPADQTAPWYHGNISRKEAEIRLLHKIDGSFLIRESTHYPGDFTLCVSYQGHAEHYRIRSQDGSFSCDQEEYFPSLSMLRSCRCRSTVACLTYELGGGDLSDFSIQRDELQLGEVIGHGEFGDVLMGSYAGMKVAVKVLKRGDHVVESLLQEAAMMTSLCHENLVKLLGLVCSGNVYLVTEYMSNGSLLDYLRSRGRQQVSKRQQICFASGICSGMVYLESRNLVHRDLAARNILLSENMTPKISDFGLARRANNLTVEDATGRFPIKWTAPEALKHNKFTSKSDVWSFGILLWEIYSFGRVPYPRIPVEDVVRYVEKGYRMESPEGCPSDMAKLMLMCWSFEPENRPTFADMYAMLQMFELSVQ